MNTSHDALRGPADVKQTLSKHLLRLLRDENAWSDLIAFLHQRQPHILAEFAGLPSAWVARREVRLGRGVIDLVLFDSVEHADRCTQPRAAVEVKIDAGVHGEQFDTYDAACDKLGIPVDARVVLRADSQRIEEVPKTWRQIDLLDVTKAWATSSDDVTRCLAADLVSYLELIRHHLVGSSAFALDGGGTWHPGTRHVRVVDRLAIRRAYARLERWIAASSLEVEAFGERSKGGAVNFGAQVVSADGSSLLHGEIQRRGGKPGLEGEFMLTVGVRPIDADSVPEEHYLARLVTAAFRWRNVLAGSAILNACPALRDAKVAGVNGFKRAEIKPERDCFYGYSDTAIGSRFFLDIDVRYDELPTILEELLVYLGVATAEN